MTRTGSLAYYLAAIVCGSFFYTLVHSLADSSAGGPSGNWARDFLFLFFLGTIFGWFPQLVAAFLLRRVAVPLGWDRAWHWIVGGAGVYLFVFVVLGIAGAQLERYTAGTRYESINRILLGLDTLAARSGIWQGLLAGAATSFVLYRVHGAFSPSRAL
jgi:hypothetical protein